MRRKHLSTAAVTASLAAAAATTLAAVPADASGHHGISRGVAPTYKVVAKGLHNPRQIAFRKGGAMFVAEAGSGGDGPCITGGEGPSCYGKSGSIMRVLHGTQHRVLKGLSSVANQGTGEGALGVSDLRLVGKHGLVVSFGLGAKPSARGTLPRLARRQLGHLIKFNLHTKRFTSLGDLARHEAKTNPIDDPNSDPTGIVRAGKGMWLVTDSGGNTLVSTKGGKVTTVAEFPNRKVTGGGGQEYETVPTDVVKGPDGAFYVSELTGFPFSPGAARIWRVKPGSKPRVYADGLTNVTSIAWHKGSLYAVQIADGGLQAGPPGSLVKVAAKGSGDTTTTVAPGLFFPYGVAFRKNAAYVSQGAMFPTGGTVVKIPLS